MKEKVMDLFREFYYQEKFEERLNATFLVLILKK